MADHRDGMTWAALELTYYGEKLVEEGTFAQEVRRILEVGEDWPIFIPSKAYEKKGRKLRIYLMEGYAFAATGLDEVRYFKLEQSKYVEKVMTYNSDGGMRVLRVITNRDIAHLKDKLGQEATAWISPGMQVLVQQGLYRGIEGRVEDIIGDHAVVRISLRSITILTLLPKVALETNF